MNHTAGSRGPAELHTGGGEERGGGKALPQWPEEWREGALQALQAGTINPSGSHQKYKEAASPCILFVESLAWPCAHPPQAPASSSFSCFLLFPSRLFSFYLRPSICPAFWCQGHSQLHTSTHANRAHNVADCKGWTDGRQSDGEEEEKEVCRTQCVDKIMISPSSPLLISAGCLLPWRRLCRGSSAICLEELPTRNSCHPLIPQTLGRIQHLPAAALCQSHLTVPTVAFASHSSRQPC